MIPKNGKSITMGLVITMRYNSDLCEQIQIDNAIQPHIMLWWMK